MNFETFIALASFLLSLGLLSREIYKNQASFDIAYSFTGDPNTNDIIALYNKSYKPVTISNIQLFKNYGTSKEKELDIGLFADFIIISINPHSIYKLQISEQYKFSLYDNATVYLKLKILGRKKYKVVPLKIS